MKPRPQEISCDHLTAPRASDCPDKITVQFRPDPIRKTPPTSRQVTYQFYQSCSFCYHQKPTTSRKAAMHDDSFWLPNPTTSSRASSHSFFYHSCSFHFSLSRDSGIMSCFCFKPRHGAHSPEENGARDRADTAVEMRPSGTSMSSAVTVCQGSFPDLPIAYDTLKLLLREGLMPEARLFWWPLLPRVMVGTTMRTDPKIKSIATALYLKSKVLLSPDQQPSLSSYDTISTPSVTGTVRADLNTSADTTTNAKPIKNTSTSSPPRTHAETLKALYSARVRELLELLTVLYDIPEPGLITPLLGILVLMIPSIDICLQVCFDLLCRQDWFLPLSTAEHRLNVFSFKELLKKHLPDEYRALDESGALQAANLDLIFVNFFQSLLPFQSVVRVLDCYLLEGTKVLCNFGLGLIFLNRDLTHLTLSPKAPLSR